MGAGEPAVNRRRSGANPAPAPEPHIELVIWTDPACTHDEISSDEFPKLAVVHTVGWLLDEDLATIVVALETLEDGDGNDTYRCTTRIPKSIIVERRRLG